MNCGICKATKWFYITLRKRQIRKNVLNLVSDAEENKLFDLHCKMFYVFILKFWIRSDYLFKSTSFQPESCHLKQLHLVFFCAGKPSKWWSVYLWPPVSGSMLFFSCGPISDTSNSEEANLPCILQGKRNQINNYTETGGEKIVLKKQNNVFFFLIIWQPLWGVLTPCFETTDLNDCHVKS